MMLSPIVGLLLLGQPALGGAEIVVQMEGGKSFTIKTDPKGSPKTVQQIVGLVQKGFYNGQRFHRVEPWVVQWGDPISKKSATEPGVGGGGSGKNMPFESSKIPFKRGVVGIASTGTKVGGDSQIFVLTKDAEHLNGSYAVLGIVTKGMNVVDSLKVGSKIVKMSVSPKATGTR